MSGTPARRLKNELPGMAEKYKKSLEKYYFEHQMNTRLIEVDKSSAISSQAKDKIDAIDSESKQYRVHAEKKCRKIKSG